MNRAPFKNYQCHDCKQLCEPVDDDVGGYEEVWGAREWVPQIISVSDCCKSEYVEVSEAEAERIENA